MSHYIDIAHASLNKYGEELCGDSVQIIRKKDYLMAVMADGLGSGVKANILSTLTTRIVSKMLDMGSELSDVVDTVAHTLPICKERNIAYSTFTVVSINADNVHVVEYDNPSIFYFKNGVYKKIDRKCVEIGDKKIYESSFKLDLNDALIIVSDGVIHAGVGGILNLGWQWENVQQYLEKTLEVYNDASDICYQLITTCNNLYKNKPGDDTTAIVIKVNESKKVTVMVGPPILKNMDEWVVRKLMKNEGLKVVCGGTAAKIVGRVLNKKVITTTDYIDPDIPPPAFIDGIDLVTEGVLTLRKTVEIFKEYIENSNSNILRYSKKDAATRLFKILNYATDVNFLVGQAVNSAHQNPDFPADLRIKVKIVEELINLLEKLNKNVEVNYF
ncbi:SpoIIE family protein phosphatase [Thermoanaerobacterium thermosaccharolyticum]|uniref:Serine/threonine protein phosphatase n=2 Tax=Thermoanaerobacterium thermosaccharolyticum TaxID=1517 RepID=A0A231VIE0_THETR|nr:SpoIIE family protein phosphatase [Thermoanaerobacterium thermosaccharolyticum]OXT07818.1 serine/threonine protein phosphatase [Thermoanaerobacterium thermosaccharolyticum]